MEIIFATDSPTGLRDMISIPVVPHIDFIEQETKDEEFVNIKGETLTLIGGKGAKKFTITSFFPSKLYSFVSFLKFRPPLEYITFFEKHRDSKIPIRVMVIDRYQVVLNMLCRYTFSYQLRDRAGDVPYTLEIREYILPNSRGGGYV